MLDGPGHQLEGDEKLPAETFGRVRDVRQEKAAPVRVPGDAKSVPFRDYVSRETLGRPQTLASKILTP